MRVSECLCSVTDCLSGLVRDLIFGGFVECPTNVDISLSKSLLVSRPVQWVLVGIHHLVIYPSNISF